MDYVAAYQMLTRSAPVRPGDTVLVQGAGGGVGTAFMQLARLMGVRVLGSDREATWSHVESQGGVLIDFEHGDVVERCLELTAGRGVDVAFDGVGATAGDSLRTVGAGGRLVCFGMMGSSRVGIVIYVAQHGPSVWSLPPLPRTFARAASAFPVTASRSLPGSTRICTGVTWLRCSCSVAIRRSIRALRRRGSSVRYPARLRHWLVGRCRETGDNGRSRLTWRAVSTGVTFLVPLR